MDRGPRQWCLWGGVVGGEILGSGREIQGEISRHLAAHMHTRPSWETKPQIQAWWTWKRHKRCCRREESLSLSHSFQLSFFLSLSLLISYLLFVLIFHSLFLPCYLTFAPLRRFSRMHVCVRKKGSSYFSVFQKRLCTVVFIFIYIFFNKMSQETSNKGWSGRCSEGARRRKVHRMVNRLFKGATL